MRPTRSSKIVYSNEIKQIISERQKEGEFQYLVKWEDELRGVTWQSELKIDAKLINAFKNSSNSRSPITTRLRKNNVNMQLINKQSHVQAHLKQNNKRIKDQIKKQKYNKSKQKSFNQSEPELMQVKSVQQVNDEDSFLNQKDNWINVQQNPVQNCNDDTQKNYIIINDDSSKMPKIKMDQQQQQVLYNPLKNLESSIQLQISFQGGSSEEENQKQSPQQFKPYQNIIGNDLYNNSEIQIESNHQIAQLSNKKVQQSKNKNNMRRNMLNQNRNRKGQIKSKSKSNQKSKFQNILNTVRKAGYAQQLLINTVLEEGMCGPYKFFLVRLRNNKKFYVRENDMKKYFPRKLNEWYLKIINKVGKSTHKLNFSLS